MVREQLVDGDCFATQLVRAGVSPLPSTRNWFLVEVAYSSKQCAFLWRHKVRRFRGALLYRSCENSPAKMRRSSLVFRYLSPSQFYTYFRFEGHGVTLLNRAMTVNTKQAAVHGIQLSASLPGFCRLIGIGILQARRSLSSRVKPTRSKSTLT